MSRFIRIATASLLLAAFGIGQIATAADEAAPATDTRSECVKQCDAAETQCSSQVRRARQECSKQVATQGRDPFSQVNRDYGYFCGYFNAASPCAAGNYGNACRSRFARTYGLCVDAIRQNTASARYDCQQTEKTAQGYCRDELRACRDECAP